MRITHLQSGAVSEFAYDGFSRRVTEIERDSNGNGNIIKQLSNIGCDETLCTQLDEQGNTVNQFFAQGEVQNGQPYLYMQDQLGSVYGLVKPNGTVAGYSAYDPYGNLVFEEGTQPIMAYAGLYKHDASDLYLATYRAYNPVTARWLNRDPIREAGGLNLYAYVGGNPVRYSDLVGLEKIPVIGALDSGQVRGLTLMTRGSLALNKAESELKAEFSERFESNAVFNDCQKNNNPLRSLEAFSSNSIEGAVVNKAENSLKELADFGILRKPYYMIKAYSLYTAVNMSLAVGMDIGTTIYTVCDMVEH